MTHRKTEVKAGEKREVLWQVSWDSAELNYETDQDYGGLMKDVSGTIYERGKPVGTFRADTARAANKKSDSLKMSGHVLLTSMKSPSALSGNEGGDAHADKRGTSVLTCDELEWDAAEGIVKAKGSVNMNTSDYQIGPLPALWATATLDVFGTPDLFPKEAAARSNRSHGGSEL